jgi:hypothetical protein
MLKKLSAIVFFVLVLAWLAGLNFTLNWNIPQNQGTVTRADVEWGLTKTAEVGHTVATKGYTYAHAAWVKWNDPEQQEQRARVRSYALSKLIGEGR